jgi:hypothetical protein
VEAIKTDSNKDRSEAPLRRLLMFSVALEGLTAVGLFVFPSFVAGLLLGSALSLEAVAVARTCAVALFSLVTACSPGLRREGTPFAASLRGMFSYNAMAGAYFLYLWAQGHTVGVLLLPAAALHLVLAVALLSVTVLARSEGPRRQSSSGSSWPSGSAAIRRG